MVRVVDPASLDPAWMLVLLGLAGALAAIINTMAGGGSMLVIPVLLAMGLPASTANGTLRVGVVALTATASLTFYRKGVREHRAVGKLVIPMMVGAGAGSYAATILPDDVLRTVFGVSLVVWAVLLVVRPGAFSAEASEPRAIGPAAWAGALGIGLYGGFLQVGVGFPMLALLVVGLHYTPIRANAIKLMLVLGYTAVALPIFALAGQVAWRESIVLGIGMAAGGYLGTRLQLRTGAKVIRWVVVITVCIAGVAMLR